MLAYSMGRWRILCQSVRKLVLGRFNGGVLVLVVAEVVVDGRRPQHRRTGRPAMIEFGRRANTW